MDCGDNSCLFAEAKGGMRTNGGCRCLRDLPHTLQRDIHRCVLSLKQRLASIDSGHARQVVELAAVRRLAHEREAEHEAAIETLRLERDHWRATAHHQSERISVLEGVTTPHSARPRERVAGLERERDALKDVVSSAREVTSWDWLRLLVDHPDAETVREDVQRLDGALAALDEAIERGDHVRTREEPA